MTIADRPAQDECVWALQAFAAQEADEIAAFEMGDKLLIYERDDGFGDGWWKGKCVRTGEVGLFPGNFTTDVDPDNCGQIESAPSNADILKATQIVEEDQSTPSHNPNDWTVSHVSRWLRSLDGFDRYVDTFRQHDMDGCALLSPFLDLNALKELGIFALERRLYFMNQVSGLRQRAMDAGTDIPSPVFTPPPSPYHSQPFPSLSAGQSQSSFFSQFRKHGISSAAISQKSPYRQLKPRSQTVDVTPKVPQNVQNLSDVLHMTCDGSLDNCDFHGYLFKRGGHAHWSWKRRFFVLKSMTLWYFKSDSADAKVLGLIILPSYQILPAQNTNVKSGVFTFVAAHPDARTYSFRAESVDDMTAWMNAMVRASLGLPPSTANSPRQSTIIDNGMMNMESTAELVSKAIQAKVGKRPLKSNIQLDPHVSSHMDAIVKHMKDLHTQGRKFPSARTSTIGSLRNSASMQFATATAAQSSSSTSARESLLKSVNPKTSDEYVMWINSILFSADAVVVTSTGGEETEIQIPHPPPLLEPIKHLHLDITDGVHITEFLLRIVSRELVRENIETSDADVLTLAIERMVDHYRKLMIPKPTYRIHMQDNLRNIWRILRIEMQPDRLQHWLSVHASTEPHQLTMRSISSFRSNAEPEIISRLDRLGISIDGIYQGNLQQILLMMNEIERLSPMDELA